MGFLSGLGFGGYHHKHHGAMRAVAGLGRVLAGKTGTQVTKQTREVVASFVRGESSEGSCTKKSGGCEVQSDGFKLTVKGQVLASRDNPTSDLIKVCIPTRLAYEALTPEENALTMQGKRVKRKQSEESKSMVGTAATLMRVLGTGIGSRSIRDGERILSSSSMRKGGARVLVPGECVQVKVTPEMQEMASDMIAATATVKAGLKDGEKATMKSIRAAAAARKKARAAAKEEAAKQKRLAALAKARAARAEASAAKKEAEAAKKAGDASAAAAAKKDEKAATAEAKKAETVAKQAAKVEQAAKEEKKEAAAPAAAAPAAKGGRARGKGGKFVKKA